MMFAFLYKVFRHLVIKDLIRSEKKRFIKYGSNLRFSPHNSFFTYESIDIGNNVFINHNAYFAGRISIGDDVLFGPYTLITNGHHAYDNVGDLIYNQGRPEKKAIMIENDSWIGARTILLQNASVGQGSIVGAGSVVTKEMPPFCICVGNPCKPVKYRYTDTELKQHFYLTGKSSDTAEAVIIKRCEMFNLLNE